MADNALSEAHGESIPESDPILFDWLMNVDKQHSNRTAIACLHQKSDRYFPSDTNSHKPYLRWSFSGLNGAAHCFAQNMVANGVRPGMRIVAFLSNCVELHIAFRAALELNCPFAPINPRAASSADEVKNVYKVINPAVVIAEDLVLASKLETLDLQSSSKIHLRVVANHDEPRIPLDGWQSFATLLETRKDLNPPIPDIARDENDVVLVFMTGGTTSLPKGCPHTNRSITATLRCYIYLACFDKSRVLCSHLPSSHMFGFLMTYGAQLSGLPVVHPASWFDAESTLRAIREEKCSDMGGVPAMMIALRNHPDFVPQKTSSLKFIILGATTVTRENLKLIKEELGASKASDGYGMSEVAPISCGRYDDLDGAIPELVTSGPVVPGITVRIIDPETGKVVPRGQPGELRVSGRNVITEYWRPTPKNKDDDTFYSDDQGRWFRTGDQAIMLTGGRIRIVGRYKDLIIRGGENITPRAIEDLLSRTLNLMAEVIGIPDEIAGEVPVAVVKRGKGQDISDSVIKQTVVQDLGPSFALEAVVDVEALGYEDFPRSAAGKVQKNNLRQQVLDYFAKQATSLRNVTHLNGEGSPDDMTNALIRIWTNMLGASEGDITADTSILEWADSLTMGRFPTLLQRETGKGIRLQNLVDNSTPAAQAQFLQSANGAPQSGTLQLFPTREGPPEIQDMVHTYGDESRFERTIQICKSTLVKMGMDWDDVQDVVPLYSFQAHFLPRTRHRSYNHRHAWACPGIDVQKARIALETALSHHDMLRTMAVMFDDQTPLHIVMRAGKKWYDNCITTLDQPVQTAKDLESIFFNDTKFDFAAFPGPLFRAYIVHIKDENCAGILYVGQHSIFDAISLSFFLEDLDLLMTDPKERRLSNVTPFKAYVDSAYNLRTSIPARTSVAWHVDRLKDLRTMQAALFPVQRVPEWFKGDHAGWIDPSTGNPGIREPQGGPDGYYLGAEGISAPCTLSGMHQLKKEHAIETPCIMKAALAILNSRRTGQRTTLFSQPQAARNWSFVPDWQEALLPPAMTIDGPMVEMVALTIDLSPELTLLELLQYLQTEQTLLNKHHHAPFDDIVAALDPEAGAMMTDLSRRQVFNWLPPSTAALKFKAIRKVQLLSRADTGLQWNCMQGEGESVIVMPSWDGAQLSLNEVQGLMEEFIEIAEMVGKQESWNRKIEDVL